MRIAQDAAANNPGSWTCPMCRGETVQEESLSNDSLQCGKTGCKTPIYTKNLYITCGKCEKAFHKTCTDIEKRTDQDRAAREVGSTICPKCKAADAPDSVNIGELGRENSNSIKGFKEKQLRILQ